MPHIQVLDERTANQIAAGEVVERPASVVKELVENSLDAGARRVTVVVEGGGQQLIRVTDDGCGMEAADARLCLERHATSKIRAATDLLRITTLGFRGEAIPSIASVSRFEIRTRQREALEGTRVAVDGGVLQAVEPVGAPPGTQVEVRDLFYNVPARLKYMKTAATELGRIGDVLGRLALAHPEVALHFRSGTVEVLQTPGKPDDLLAAAAAVFGRELARELAPVSLETPFCRVWGYIGLPSVARAGRATQHFMVNGRPVQALQLRYAFEEAYANLIPQGRYPICVINLELDPAEVDANVHPAKLEVRFQKEREVRGALYKAARAALGAAMVVPVGMAPEPVPPPVPGAAVAESLLARMQGTPAAGAAGAAGPGVPSVPADGAPATQPSRDWQRAGTGVLAQTGPDQAPGQRAFYLDGAYVPPDSTRMATERSGLYTAAERETAAAALAEALQTRAVHAGPANAAELIRALRPLGQIHRSYVVCDGPGGLYVVDQHAAHERINFERIYRDLETHTAPVQALLFPITLELTVPQFTLFKDLAATFAESGIRAEPFGGRTVLVKAVPVGVDEAQAARLVTDFIDRLLEEQLPSSPLDRRRRVVAALAACKASIRAREALQPEQIAALLADLAACTDPGQCPHGRPTVLLFSVADLEKRFGRA